MSGKPSMKLAGLVMNSPTQSISKAMPPMQIRAARCLRGQSVVISSDQSNGLCVDSVAFNQMVKSDTARGARTFHSRR
jgi:hypothetical protein